MRQSVRILFIAILLVCHTAQAVNRLPEDELVDPLCAPSQIAPIQRHTTFVNGTRIYNWEIRLLTKGNHFNYEICRDKRSNTNVNKLPQEFPIVEGKPNPCVLASDVWIHKEGIDEFKKSLKVTLKNKIQTYQTRQDHNELYAKAEPILSVASVMAESYIESGVLLAYIGLRISGRLSVVEGTTFSIRNGSRAVKLLKALAFLSGIDLAFKAYSRDFGTQPVIKSADGQVVTESTQAAEEIKEVVRDIQEKLNLSSEQSPILVNFIFEQLRNSIPEAMDRTSQHLGCIQGT